MQLIIDDRPDPIGLGEIKGVRRAHVVHWRSPSCGSDSSVSITDSLDENAVEVREEFHNWLESQYRFWAEKLHDESVRETFGTLEVFAKANFSRAFYLNDLLKTLMLIRIFPNEEVNQIIIYSDNPFLERIVTYFYPDSCIEIIASDFRNHVRRIFFSLNRIFISFFCLIHGILKFGLLAIKRESENSSKKEHLLFFSYAHLFREDEIFEIQKYWGNLFDKLADRAKWILVPIDDFNFFGIFNFFLFPKKKLAKNITYLTDHLKFKILLGIIKKYFRLQFYLFRFLFFDNNSVGREYQCSRFLIWVSLTSRSLFDDLVWSNLASVVLLSRRPQKVFFLFENQPWERSLACDLKRKLSRSSCFGVCHSTVRFWDLRYQLPSSQAAGLLDTRIHIPHQLISNGQLQVEMLLEGGWQRSQLLVAEALRFGWLQEIRRKSSSASRPIVVGLVGEYEQELFNKQAKIIKTVQSRLASNGINFIFKPHPMASKVPTNIPVDRGGSLTKFLSEVDVVVCWHITSVSFDAWLLSIPVILYLERGVINLSPVRGFADVAVVRNESGLLAKLDRARMVTAFQKRFDSYVILENSELPRWQSIALEADRV